MFQGVLDNGNEANRHTTNDNQHKAAKETKKESKKNTDDEGTEATTDNAYNVTKGRKHTNTNNKHLEDHMDNQTEGDSTRTI